MTPVMLNKEQQAAGNRAYVRALLWKRQPAFAAALAAAEQSLSSPARPCRQCARPCDLRSSYAQTGSREAG
jgi:hypothetical protein